MRNFLIKNYWFGRLLASDPGYIRLQKAGRATLSLIASIFTTIMIMRATGQMLITPSIVAGMTGMMGIMVVMDDSKKKKQSTTLLLGVSAMLGITAGSFLAGNFFYIDALLLALVFSSFYLTRYGSRYFSLSMIGFMTTYFSSILNLSSNQLPWFYIGIWIGVIYAFIFNFILFQKTAANLKRSIHSFHIQSNLIFSILLKGIQERKLSPKLRKSLRNNIFKLRDYAVTVSEYINEEDVQELWPGLTPAQLRLYVFDTGMLIETLADSVQSLKKADALEIDELRRLLVWVIESLRDAEVLAENYEKQNLQEAELAVQALRFTITEMLDRDQETEGWLFLIRRIESISNHVIEGAITLQQSLDSDKPFIDDSEAPDEETAEEDSKDEDTGLKPSTKKAYQALAAGILSIIVGQLISPAQPYWVLLTAYIVLLGTESIGRIYTKAFQRSYGTIIGALLGFALARFVSGHTGLEVALIFVVVFFAFYLFTVSYTMMSMFITMLVAFMYDLLLNGITVSLIGARVIDTIAGAGIAFVVSMVIFPKKTKDKVSEALNDYLEELRNYVLEYVRGFREDVNVKELSRNAILLDQKLKTIRDEAKTLLERGGLFHDTTTSQWITIIEAINYYARHLVASSYRKDFEYPDELEEVFKSIEQKLKDNFDALPALIEGTRESQTVHRLDWERELIERLAPSRFKAQRDLIHHLYYVWRINRSIVELGIELGAEEKTP